MTTATSEDGFRALNRRLRSFSDGLAVALRRHFQCESSTPPRTGDFPEPATEEIKA